MAKDPILPLYYNDITRSTITWTDEEFGSYMRLLIEQWDKGYITSDIKRLSRVSETAEKHWDLIGAKFEEIAPGKLQNDTMENIRERRQKFKAIQSEKGKKGAEVKAKLKPSTQPNFNQDTSQTSTEIKPLETEIEKEKEIVKGKRKKEKSAELIFPYDSEEFKNTWKNLTSLSKWKNKDHVCLQASLRKLSRFPEIEAVEMMKNSIEGNWQGLFELKPHEKNSLYGKQQQTSTKQTRDQRISDVASLGAAAAELLQGFNNSNNGTSGTG